MSPRWINEIVCNSCRVMLRDDACPRCGRIACRDPLNGQIEGWMIPTSLIPEQDEE